LSGP
jgi:hypothetical protein